MAEFEFSGLCAATFAPMKDNGDLKLSAIPEYAEHLAKNNVRGVFVNGTNGEGIYSLTFDERKQIAESWLKEKDKVPTIIIHVSGCNFREAQKLAAHAEQNGATAIGIMPSMYVSPKTVDDLVEWVRRIAEAAPKTPCLYYHIPHLTHVSLPMVDFLKIGSEQIPTLVGIKFSSREMGEAGNCQLLTRSNGKPFQILHGCDDSYLGQYSYELKSAIGSFYNFAPQLFHQIHAAVDGGNIEKARELQLILTNMTNAIFKHGSPGLVPQKMTMQLLTGIQLGPPRFPQIEMNPDHAKDLQENLKSLNIGQFHFK